MAKTNSYTIHKTHLMRNPAVHTLVMFVLLSLFVFSGATDCKAERSVSLLDHASIESAQSVRGPFHSVHVPIGAQTFPGPETPDENDLEEEFDFDDDTNDYWKLSLNISSEQDSSESLHIRYRKLFQNRPAVSLFILHHSWKSYLS